MTRTPSSNRLSRREREIMNALFAVGNRASADDIRQRLTAPPSYSAVRAMLERYVRERRQDAYGIYVGDTETGTVQTLALEH